MTRSKTAHKKTLSEMLVKASEETETIEFAVKLRDGLRDTAKNATLDAQMMRLIGKDGTKESRVNAAELKDYEATIAVQAALMLEKLGTEVTRLRLSIGCHLDTGDPTRADMRKIVTNWNGDKP